MTLHNCYLHCMSIGFRSFAKQGLVEMSRLIWRKASRSSFSRFKAGVIAAIAAPALTALFVATEAGVTGGKERVEDYLHEVRALSFALMNAGIRANMDEKATLQKTGAHR